MSIQGKELIKYANKYYIETGSFHGDGIQDALDAGFEKVISIEITPVFYDECIERFKNDDRVEIILGDSVIKLPKIIENIKHKCVIMLDAHYMENLSTHNGSIVPLIEELEAITEHARKYNDTIMIDDMRCWTEADFYYIHKIHSLTNQKLIDKVLEINKNYTISFDDGHIPNDVLVAEIK